MQRGVPILGLLVLLGPAWAGEQPVVTTDLLRLRTVTSIDVTADGSKAVLAVRSIAPREAPETASGAGEDDEPGYAYRSHLFLLDLFDLQEGPRQLTFGDRLDREPRFAPDGRRIAFIRGDEQDNGDAQVWVMRTDGGEARPASRLDHGVASGSGQWSPDGRLILVRSMIPIDEMPGEPPYPTERPNRQWSPGSIAGVTPRPDGTRAEIRAWLDANAARQDPSVITRLSFQDEQKLRGPLRFGQLFLVDPEQATATQITDGFFDHSQPAFLPDGSRIVYAAKKDPTVHPDRILGTDLWWINADGTADERLLWLEGWSLEQPRPNRDGTLIAFAGRRLDEPAFRLRCLGLGSSEGVADGEPVWLTGGDDDTSLHRFDWEASKSALLFTGPARGGFPLSTISPGLLEPATLVDEQDGLPVGVYAFDAGGGAIVYAMTGAANPCVVMVRDGRGERLAWDPNPWAADKRLSRPVPGSVVRPDGTRVQYWLMEPTGRRPGETYPLALEIHGGPSAMWGPGELTMWHEFQLLCSWGYGVAYSNPRGSGGYGYEFRRANFQDWGEGPAGDVLAVLDQVALKEWIDEDRLVVTGGSYAGYLTAWIVAHDHRFKAAVAQRGVYDLATFFGEGNAWRLVEWTMGGYPFDARYRAIIDRNSPFTYVGRIRTPLLIMHASEDLRTGVSQSEMLYRALKALQRPVEYVRYPGAGHDLSRSGDPGQRMDRLNRIIEFFERYIENPRPAPAVSGQSPR